MACSAQFSLAQRTTISTTLGGGLETEGMELTVCAFSTGWQGMQVQGDWKTAEQGQRRFRLMSEGESCFEGMCRYEQRGDSIQGEIQLTCTRDISMQSLSVAMIVPLSKNRGKAWQADGLMRKIPVPGAVAERRTNGHPLCQPYPLYRAGPEPMERYLAGASGG